MNSTDESWQEERLSDSERRTVLRELESILNSSPFRSSHQCQTLLRYLVENSLDGRKEMLKERLIGMEVFGRKPDYATGEDPIVRARVGEVRKRLAQYFLSEESNGANFQLIIPPRSYLVQFQNRLQEPAAQGTAGAIELALQSQEAESPQPPSAGHLPSARRWKPWTALAAFLVLAVATLVFVAVLSRRTPPQSASDLFWAPIMASPNPAMICIARPILYLPRGVLYDRYARIHPGTFQTMTDKNNQVLPLDPSEKITWGDIGVANDYGVAVGDVYVAVSLAAFFAQMRKKDEMRIGTGCSFEDLRNAPAVVIGAFNNRWTADLTSDLHFAFEWRKIREQTPPGRTWTQQFGPDGKVSADYGLVTRLVNSKTGQAMVVVAGLGSEGTQASGELVTSPQYLDEALKSVPKDWSHRNIQLVVRTDLHEEQPGPPQVIATYVW